MQGRLLETKLSSNSRSSLVKSTLFIVDHTNLEIVCFKEQYPRTAMACCSGYDHPELDKTVTERVLH